MRRASRSILVAAYATALGAGGCAHATRPVTFERPPGGAVSHLSDLPSMPGAKVVVLLRTGERTTGALETIDGNVLVLRVTQDPLILRRVAEEEQEPVVSPPQQRRRIRQLTCRVRFTLS